MRLSHIKLAGFKSFVDPTIVSFPANLSGIVGPNGCGKSNIIDAVRWVMGESSAKTLRGESMTDVVFSGSTTRKPSGLASIELHFDNREGSLGGMFAEYPEIIVRRQVNLEGHSTYYLNGSVCRRRDITDIFLGTGLGPRSYAIIEQGMISRLIEAKPEELRIYLEEAAGISKYKERRRETELRLQHTRDNLARLNDIREELQKQLDRLSQQARQAEKYQQLKSQEKIKRAELFALRARALEAEMSTEKTAIEALEAALDAENTAAHALSDEQEAVRRQSVLHQEALEQVQKEFYEANTTIARLEEQLQHHKAHQQKLEKEAQQTTHDYTQALHQQEEEKAKETLVKQSLVSLSPQKVQAKAQLENARDSLSALETQFHHWQTTWDTFNQEAAQHLREAHSEQVKVEHSEKQLHQLKERIKQLSLESQQYTETALSTEIETLQAEMEALQEKIDFHQKNLADLHESLQSQRQSYQTHQEQLDARRTHLHSLRGRFASLQALQEAALGKTNAAEIEWLKTYHLENYPRLVEKLKVEEGFELAVETVLNHYLEGICLEGLGEKLNQFSLSNSPALTLIDEKIAPTFTLTSGTLAVHCEGPAAILQLLSAIYITNTLAEALEILPQLAPHASVITREGLWLGHGWLSGIKSEDHKGGIILREKMLTALQHELGMAVQAVEEAQFALQESQQSLLQLEHARDETQSTIAALTGSYAELNAKLKVQEIQLQQQNQRQVQIQNEIERLNTQKIQEEEVASVARQRGQTLTECVEKDAQTREQLQKTREEERQKLQVAREAFEQLQHQLHTLSTQLEVLHVQHKSSEALQVRLGEESEAALRKQEDLKVQLAEQAPLEAQYRETLNQLLYTREVLGKKVEEKRRELSSLEQTLKILEQKQKNHEEKRQHLRTQVEEKRLLMQSAFVRVQSFKEQLQEIGYTLSEVLLTLSAESEIAECEAILNKLVQGIERLGAVNLTAITEYAEQAARKTYLDQQHEDLMTALGLLEEAIRKIDQETRTQFKEIYEKVNTLFQALFPRIFGGGQASLELTGQDLLETGVSVIARPPGKRNSTIHLLSGGEKALTAIALVFSIFQLNPAPFCMLDEVDAPLDDANIGRFCALVKEMSAHIQFIFISHNKLAIEMAEHLIGVTMKEPGVSRLVAVDVNAAMEMAGA